MSLMLDDELALINDSQYKNYITAIEKQLRKFDSSSEWADLIRHLLGVKQVRSAFPDARYNVFLNCYIYSDQ